MCFLLAQIEKTAEPWYIIRTKDVLLRLWIVDGKRVRTFKCNICNEDLGDKTSLKVHRLKLHKESESAGLGKNIGTVIQPVSIWMILSILVSKSNILKKTCFWPKNFINIKCCNSFISNYFEHVKRIWYCLNNSSKDNYSLK